jgi:hypothetical protein
VARTTALRRAALVVLAVALSACSGVPDSGAVKDEKSLPLIAEADDVRVLAESAHSGQSAVEVVRGFLRAAASFDDDHAVARTYLDSRASSSWQPSGAGVYGGGLDPQVTPVSSTPTTAVVSFVAPRVAEVTPDGTWNPSAPHALLRDRFALVKRDGEWRISDPPQSLRLTPGDIERSFRAVSVYFLSPNRDVVVPDHRYLPVERRALSTALVRTLLAGPSRAVAGSVRTAVPAGTKLIGTAPVVDGVVTVDLSRAVLDADARGLVELSAQLVWTLRELGTEFTELRLLAEGAPLKVAGASATQHATAWAQFDADEGADVAGYLDARGRLVRVGGGVFPGPVASGSLRLATPALGPGAKAVAGIGSGPSLWAGPLTGPHRVATALAFTGPSIDHSGRVWVVEQVRAGQRVVAFDNGARRAVASPLPTSGVSALRVSRDGTRVAVIVRGRLLVGRIEPAGTALRIGALVTVAPELTQALDVSWVDGDELVVLARGPATPRPVPWFVSADGYRVQQAPASGDVQTGYSAIAAGSGNAPLLVADAANVYRYVAGRWTRIGRGSSPTYAG